MVPWSDASANEGNVIDVVACDFCGELVQISAENKNHILDDCSAARTASQVVQETDGPARKRPSPLSLVDRFYELLRARTARRDMVKEVVLSPGASSPAAPFGDDRRANAADKAVT